MKHLIGMLGLLCCFLFVSVETKAQYVDIKSAPKMSKWLNRFIKMMENLEKNKEKIKTNPTRN